MNKKLFEKVKGLCKDTGLSEKYLKAITERMGGSIEDDSADEAAMEEIANQIAEIAKETQGEATRWATIKKTETKKTEDPAKQDPEKPDETESQKEIRELRERLENMEKNQLSSLRSKAIEEAIVRHKLDKSGNADTYREYLTALPDKDIEEYLTGKRQIENIANLDSSKTEGSKAAIEAAAVEQANSLLESITVK